MTITSELLYTIKLNENEMRTLLRALGRESGVVLKMPQPEVEYRSDCFLLRNQLRMNRNESLTDEVIREKVSEAATQRRRLVEPDPRD